MDEKDININQAEDLDNKKNENIKISLIKNFRYLIFASFLFFLFGLFEQSVFIPGIVIFLSVLAFFSAIKKPLNSPYNRLIEFVLFLFIFLVILSQRNLYEVLYKNPFSNILLPSIFLVFYLSLFINKYIIGNRKRLLVNSGLVLVLFFSGYFVSYYLTKDTTHTSFLDNDEEYYGMYKDWQKLFSEDGDFEVLVPGKPEREARRYSISEGSDLFYDQDFYIATTSNSVFTVEKLIFPPSSNLSDLSLGALTNAMATKHEDSNVVSAELVNFEGKTAMDFLISKYEFMIKGRAILGDGVVYRLTVFYQDNDFAQADYERFIKSFRHHP